MNLFVTSLTLQLMGNSEEKKFDLSAKRSFLTYFHDEFFIYHSSLPTKLASCLQAMLACSGTLSYPARGNYKVYFGWT